MGDEWLDYFEAQKALDTESEIQSVRFRQSTAKSCKPKIGDEIYVNHRRTGERHKAVVTEIGTSRKKEERTLVVHCESGLYLNFDEVEFLPLPQSPIPTQTEVAAFDEGFKVDDRVIWDDCPGHFASWGNPFTITAIQGDMAELDLVEYLVPLAQLRRVA